VTQRHCPAANLLERQRGDRVAGDDGSVKIEERDHIVALLTVRKLLEILLKIDLQATVGLAFRAPREHAFHSLFMAGETCETTCLPDPS